MLTLVLTCSISAGAVWAQCSPTILSDPGGEYSFRVQEAINGQGFAPPCGTGVSTNTDPTPILTMGCLAANGYGQWTLSTTHGVGNTISPNPTSISGADEFPIGWYLLSNGLYQPSSGYVQGDPTRQQCIPPGVVQSGSFTFPFEAKAVTNLDGMVAYVWPDQASRQSFILSGLTASDIDLSLSFLSDPTPWTSISATGNMKVVTNAIHSLGTVTIPNTVVQESDWRDNFDVCADAMYIYIVWASSDPGPQESIWVAIVPIGSSTPLQMYKINVGPDNFKFPTITCDPRNNRGNPSPSNPAFDVSFLDETSNQIWYGSYSAQHGWSPYGLLSQNYWDPNNAGNTESWTIPMHARIIRNSINGGTSSLAIYAIVNGGRLTHNMQDGALIFYSPNSFGTANFVAGNELSAPTPITSPDPPVYDAPIIAFADPYDNQSGWHSIDEFHCLFQYDLWATVPASQEYPLCIVRGSDVNTTNPSQPDAPANVDTRLVLNQSGGTLQNSTVGNWYVAAANQMGIHVHWFTYDISTQLPAHFYARDMNRTFDEPIDENTLVTDQCTVSDGTSTGTNHGGTTGATLLNAQIMAIWTDPNYGPPGNDGINYYGLYSPISVNSLSPYIGTLNMASGVNSDNLALNIGRPNSWSPEVVIPAVFSVMPYFSINFLPDVDNDCSQKLIVNANSIFDYYGRIAAPDPGGIIYQFASPFQGNAWIQLIGTENFGIPNYAYLNVHSGADFYESTISKLESNGGSISMLYGPSIFPTTNVSQPSDATGHMTLHGGTYLNGGAVTGMIPHIPNDLSGNVLSQQVIMTVDPDFADLAHYRWGEEFTANGVSFSNSEQRGTSELLFGHGGNTGSTQPFLGCQLENCNLDGIRVHVFDPADPVLPSYFLVIGCNFGRIRNKCILIENDQSPTQASYGQITIENNYFNSFGVPALIDNNPNDPFNDNAYSDLGPSGVSEELPCGIYLRGLDGNGDASNNSYLVPIISGNQFTYNNGFYPKVNTNANNDWGSSLHFTNGAITLENSTAMITGNTITDNGYPVGISIFSIASNGILPKTYSVICNNTISGLVDNFPSANEMESKFDGYGVMASGLAGAFGNLPGAIISMNTIENNDDGIELFATNQPRLNFNTIKWNREIAVECQDGSLADMSSNAFNTIIGEAEETNETEQVAPISLVGSGTIELDDGFNSIIVDPANADLTNNFYNFVISSYAGTNLGNLENNFWGDGVAPATNNGTDWGNNRSESHLSWNVGSGPCSQNQTIPSSNPTCPASAGHASVITIKHNFSFQPDIPDSINCDTLWEKLHLAQTVQAGYDSGKFFVEHCFTDMQHLPFVFQDLATAVQTLFYTDTNKYVEYRQWLETVLYLNHDPQYFCLVAFQIRNTFGSASDTSEILSWKDANRGLAVEMWLYHHGLCDTASERGDSIGIRSSQKQEWLNDTTVPFDSTDPSLSDLGLDSLFNKELLYASVTEPKLHEIISNATANPNPTNEGTVISFGVSKEAYVKIELFDLLGHEVSGVNFESLFEPGNKSVPISLAGLASGTYYARILTAYGEVQTVKLVKQ